VRKKIRRQYMYGKFHHETFEFRKALHELFDSFLQEHNKLPIKTKNELMDLKNKITSLLKSWIGSKKLESKFGIKLPLSSTPPSIENFLEKQARSYSRVYKPCEVCGEDRVTHYCHIVPRSEGGADNEENYIYLCPLHHHLFDDDRLSKKEWNKIDFSKKSKVSQEYVKKVRLPIQEKFWQNKKEK